jgi:hypothetical protein
MNGSIFAPRSSVNGRARCLLLTTVALVLGSGCGLENTGLGGSGAPVARTPDAGPRPPSGPVSIDPPPGMPPQFPPPPPEDPPGFVPPPPDAAAPDTSPPDSAPADTAPGPGELPPSPPPAVTPPPAPAPPPTPGDFCDGGQALLLCLDFDGEVEDGSPAERDLRVSGVTFEAGRRGQAGRFGPGRQVQLLDGFQAFERALSLEAAIRPTAFPQSGRRGGIIHSSNEYGMFLVGPDGDVECRTPGGAAIARRAVRASAWTVVRCIFARQGVEVFIDDEQVATGDLDFPVPARSGDGIVIGTTDFEGGPFVGLIDEVRIWRGRRER